MRTFFFFFREFRLRRRNIPLAYIVQHPVLDQRVRDISLQPSSGFFERKTAAQRGSSAKLLLRPFVKVSKSTRV